MIFRMLASRRAQRQASASWLPTMLVQAWVVGFLVVLPLARETTRERGDPLRFVLSSESATVVPKQITTRSLYAKNDPWKRYLASERVCPGGERTDVPLAERAKTVACLVNYARRQRGLMELSVAGILNGASERKARAILRCDNFAHNPCGGDWTAAVRSTGYSGPFGENLYLATGRFGAPRPAVDAWLNSEPHRANLFRAAWREQGLAVVVLERFRNHEDVSLWVSVLGER